MVRNPAFLIDVTTGSSTLPLTEAILDVVMQVLIHCDTWVQHKSAIDAFKILLGMAVERHAYIFILLSKLIIVWQICERGDQ